PHEVPTADRPPLSGAMGAPVDLGTKDDRTGGGPGPETGDDTGGREG
ncbi:hypothetical protein JBF12_43095, partial [Streptomyces javensis]|nr:hypothetical protein [Streptomyces javensis]